MGGPDPVLRTLHVMAAVAVTLMIAFLARRAARSIGQPSVIGEITAGLLIGPAVVLLGGRAALDAVVPADVLGVLRTLGQAGRLGWLLLGSLLPGLLAGGVLAGWVLGFGSADLRGTAPTPALVLLLAVALSVTAVPVLARMLVGGLAATLAVRRFLASRPAPRASRLTGPLLTLVDRRAARHEAVPLPSGVPQGGAR